MDLVSEYVDTATAAELLGVQPDTVRRYMASGTLKAVRFGRSLMIHKAEIERYAKERGGKKGWSNPHAAVQRRESMRRVWTGPKADSKSEQMREMTRERERKRQSNT